MKYRLKQYMAKKEPGYVYILTNPSFREDWVKIGKSSRPVDVRTKELDNTAVPLPFEIFATMKTAKYNEAEKLVHRYIGRFTNLRIRRNREFFNVTPCLAPCDAPCLLPCDVSVRMKERLNVFSGYSDSS